MSTSYITSAMARNSTLKRIAAAGAAGIAPEFIPRHTARALIRGKEIVERDGRYVIAPLPALPEQPPTLIHHHVRGDRTMGALSKLLEQVKTDNFVILDTETTGLDHRAEVCQIAMTDHTGRALLDTFVKPKTGIPMDAQRIHGISNAMVADAPSWIDINEQVWELVRGKTVIVYNAAYDFKIIAQSEKACYPVALSDWHTVKRQCAMLGYAEFVGDWNDYRGSYAWHKLTDAARAIRYVLPANLSAHSALGDCLMTLALCRHMAEKKVSA